MYCHKDQTINILNSLNEQIDNVDDLEVCKKDRFFFNESVGVNWGLHGQLDLEDMIASSDITYTPKWKKEITSSTGVGIRTTPPTSKWLSVGFVGAYAMASYHGLDTSFDSLVGL